MAKKRDGRLRTVKRNATWEYMNKPEEVDRLLSMIADGKSLRTLCVQLGLKYVMVHSMLMQDYPQHYASAKAAAGLGFAESVEDTLKRLEEDDEFDHRRAQVLINGRQWLATRYGHAEFGDKKSVAHEHRGSIELYHDAAAQLRAAEAEGQTYTGDYVTDTAMVEAEEDDSSGYAVPDMSDDNDEEDELDALL